MLADRHLQLRAAKGRLAGELSGMGVPQLLRVLKRSSLTDAERVLVRSGAKTSAVTSIVWEQDLLDIRAAARAAPDALGDRLEIDEEGPVPAAGLQRGRRRPSKPLSKNGYGKNSGLFTRRGS